MAEILIIIGSLFLIWYLFSTIRSNPQLLSRINLSRSFMTMGLLALLLMALIGFAIAMLR